MIDGTSKFCFDLKAVVAKVFLKPLRSNDTDEVFKVSSGQLGQQRMLCQN